MGSHSLMLHRGSVAVTREELAGIEAPAATETWFPVAHRDVLATAEGLLLGAGFAIERSRFGVGRDGHEFFGVLDLRTGMGDGVALAVGLRNSTNQRFPIGLCAGSRVFVCDNLAFSAELTVTRKHTRNGMTRWTEGIGQAVGRLDQFQAAESQRIERLTGTVLPRDAADAYLLRAYESGILSARTLPEAIAQWRKPTYDWGRRGTAWHLYNAMTTALKGAATTNPQRHAGLTMKLMAHFADVVGSDGSGLMEGGSLATYRDDGTGDPADPEPEADHLPAAQADILIPALPTWDFVD